MADRTESPGVVDRLLDLTVVPGFTRIGWELRSRRFGPIPSGDGRTVVVTGASTGLGFETARACAEAGASVVLISRDPGRGATALGEIESLLSPGSTASFHPCDLSDLGDVRRLARELAGQLDSIDALVLNAGVLLHRRTVTRDGIELAWATNVVGPYLLEYELLDKLEAAGGRVVMVTSGGAYTQPLSLPQGDLQGSDSDYDGAAVYARTKRAQVALAELQSRQFEGRGISVHAVHPGWADTPGVRESLPTFRRLTGPLLRTAAQGADTVAWLALAAPETVGSGLLWHDRQPRPRHRFPMKAEGEAERLELDAELQRLTGLERPDRSRG